MSNWFKHKKPISAEPLNEIEINKLIKYLLEIKEETRISPYPPNFNKIAAKIMDPTTGASTCALGSHKCPKKIGNLIKNAKIILNKNKEFLKLNLNLNKN